MAMPDSVFLCTVTIYKKNKIETLFNTPELFFSICSCFNFNTFHDMQKIHIYIGFCIFIRHVVQYTREHGKLIYI
jgi:hypothetical protein